MLRTLLKDTAKYTIPSCLSRGLSLILMPLYTRVLNPADFGSLDLLIVFASIVNLTIAFEVSQGVARFYALELDGTKKILYASSAFWFTVVCYGAFLGGSMLTSSVFAKWIMGQTGMELVFKIGLIYIASNGIAYLILNQLRWELRSTHYVVVSLVMTFVTAAVSVWLTYFLRWGLVGLLLGMLSGSTVASVVGLWWLRASFRFRFSGKRLAEMLGFSTPLVLSGIAVWVSLYVDRLMIAHFLNVDEVGLYGIGQRMASIAGLVVIGFQGALTPLIYTHYQDPSFPEKLEFIFRLFLFISLLMFLCLTLFSTDILRIMVTPSYYGASSVVVFLVPAVLLANMYIFSPGIGIAKKTHLIVWINVTGGLMNIGLNYGLIPIFGIAGAGLATLVSCGGIFAAYTVIGQRFYPIPHNWTKNFAAIGVAVLVAGIFPHWPLPDTVRWAVNVLALTGFSLLALVCGLLKRDEISAGWRLVSHRVFFRV